MRAFIVAGALLMASAAIAQDTIHVQTLTFDSITTRRGWFQFPDGSNTYRKVLMHHRLKCDPQTTQDQFDCGEWDYLTYNIIHEHTGLLDSTALTHPHFKVGAAAPDSVEEGPPASSSYQRWTYSASVTSVNTATLSAVGTNDADEDILFNSGANMVRSQYLIPSADLTAAGLTAGAINQLRMPKISGAGQLQRVTLRMKSTPTASLTGFEEGGLITVFDDVVPFDADTLVFTFYTPYSWDGISNLLVDIACPNLDPDSAIVESTNVSAGLALQEVGTDGFIDVNNDFLGVATGPLAGLDSVITITFRAFGATALPLNTSILEARDAANRRMFNIHLPWSDSRVYWDAGGDAGGGFDRIDKAALPANIEGQWNDWAFVKNAVTGSMKIYLNGVLWHSGTNKTKLMTGITQFRIGAGSDGGAPYSGLIDEVNIFITEVSAANIAAWAARKVTDLHPDAAALLYSFHLDEADHIAVNSVDASSPAWLMGTVRRDRVGHMALGHAAQSVLLRPVMVFVQGDHTIDVDTTVTFDHKSTLAQLSIEHFAVNGNSAVPTDTLFTYGAGIVRFYGPDGAITDSTTTTGPWHMNNTLNYFSAPYPEVIDHEIGRYITPYGIGLDLGPQGFRWTYDVTDYQWLLHDSVEVSAGNQQELIDLSFDLIEGDPPRPVLDQQNPWGTLSSYSYANLDNDVSLPAVNVQLNPNAVQWSLRTRFTGHGHNSNDGTYPHCCEWKDNTHYAFANGQQIDAWHIWQTNDCASNPVYPQGGTWPGSREGWCPGDMVKDHSIELTPYVSNDQIAIDYDITPVPNNNQGMGGGQYVVNMDLFEYGAPSHSLDAEIVEVKRPTDEGYRSRENPICHDPLVTLRNAGALVLTSVELSYRVSGGQTATYTWTGSLLHMQQVDVVLPIPNGAFWAGDGNNNFRVFISNVNGNVADNYNDNDSYTTHFELPIVYPTSFVLFYKTNNRPWENSVTVRDNQNNIVFSHDNFAANTIYKDTLDLPEGCYTVELLDDGNDGLTYWADPDAGAGYFRFRSLTNQTLRIFEPEFGHSIKASFGIGTITSIQEHAVPLDITASPVPTDGPVNLSCRGVQGEGHVEVLDPMGRVIQVRDGMITDNRPLQFDLSGEPAGVYLFRVLADERVALLRVIKQ